MKEVMNIIASFYSFSYDMIIHMPSENYKAV